jgi:quinoprotein dehydrogenase-associated probable ABC transporter substrate-binding protein
MSKFSASLVASAALTVLVATGARAEMTGTEKLKAAQTDFRVCAVLNNLPFTNQAGEGFDNKIAELLAKAEGKKLTYAWWRAPRGFVSHTLGRFDCDVVMGVPSNYELTATTRPYYCSTYVEVTKAGAPRPSLERPSAARIGVMVRTPPLGLLLSRHFDPQVYLPDTLDETSVAARIVSDVATGHTDAALAWGPIAGYFASKQQIPLAIRPIELPADANYRFTFPISMGVRHSDHERLRRLNALIEQHKPEIDAILKAYGVPLVENSAQCRPRPEEAAYRAPTPAPLLQLAANQQSGASASGAPQQQAASPAANGQQQAQNTQQQAQNTQAQGQQQGNQGQQQGSKISCNGPVKQDEIQRIGGGQQGGQQQGGQPFTVQDGKVDPQTYKGWIRFAGFCERCHGTGGVGSAIAPDLTRFIPTLSEIQFKTIVTCGLTGDRGVGVMPAWGGNPNIEPYLDALWSYLQARTKGGLGPGRPQEIQTAQNQQSGQGSSSAQ